MPFHKKILRKVREVPTVFSQTFGPGPALTALALTGSRSGDRSSAIRSHTNEAESARLAHLAFGKSPAGGKLETILGSDPGHVSAERRALKRSIAKNPLAASLFFDPKFDPTQTGGADYLRSLAEKASAGTLTEAEKEFIEKQSQFHSRGGQFAALLGRRSEVVKQREAVEAARRRAPGRTQTILTRRES